MALDSDVLAILNRRTHGVLDVTVHIPKLVVLGTAKVAATPDYSGRVVEVEWDTGSTGFEDIRRGHIVRINRPSEDGRLVYEGILRKQVGASALSIAAQRKGDTGVAREFADFIQEDDDITVYRNTRPATFLSVLVEEDDVLVTYKREDLSYSSQAEYPEPHARFGRHKLVRVPVGGTATIDFTDDSYDFKGSTLERTWIPDAGMTITVGTDTDASITVEAGPGDYVMELSANREDPELGTDTSSGFRRVCVVDGPGGANPAFSDLFAIVEIRDDDQDPSGRSLVLLVERTAGVGAIGDYLYFGAAVIMQETPLFTDDDWTTYDTLTHEDGFIDQYVGYVRAYESLGVDTRGVETWAIRVVSPFEFTDGMRIPSQSIWANDPPTNWQEGSSDLMDVGFWLYGMYYYHSFTIIQWHDFRAETVRAFQLPAITWGKGTVGSAARELMSRVGGGTIGSASDGSIIVSRSPVYEDDTYRDTLATETMTLDDLDVADGLEYPRDEKMQIGRTMGVAAVTSTEEVPEFIEGEMGYLAPMDGVGDGELPSFIALSEDDALDRIGHHHQYLNRPTKELTVDLSGNQDVFEPAYNVWNRFDLDNYAPINPEVFGSSKRWLPKRIRRNWSFSNRGIDKKITAAFEPETKGERATLVPPPAIGAAFTPGAILNEQCYRWMFGGGEDIWSAISGTTFSTDRYVSVNDWVRIEATLPSAITLTEVSFFYAGGWTNASSSSAKMYLYDQTGVKATLSNITWQMSFTGLSIPGVTYIKLWWDHYPNPIWVSAYAVTGVQIRFIAETNPFGANNCE